MEFPSPSTLELRRVHSTPACLTGYVPSSGFLTLSTAYSSPERPALFHAENAHGVSLSRGFPSPSGSTGSSPRNYPHDVSPPHQHIVDARRPSPHAETRFTDLCRLQGLAPTVNPYHHRTVTSLAMADPLLSFGRLSRVLPYTHRPRRMLRVPLLRFALPMNVFGHSPATRDHPPTASAASREQAHARPPNSSSSNHRQTLVRPQTASSASCEQAHDRPPMPTSDSRGQAHDRPPTGRVRSSGFARKRGIPLRGAKLPS